MDLQRMLEELKRRRVVRAAVAYAAVLFLVLQVADIVIPAVGLPDTVLTGLVIVGSLGLPLVLVLAWAVDLTPRGFERTPAEAGGDGEGASSSSVALRALTGLLGALVVVAGSVWWVTRPEPAVDDVRALAVLPLHNLTGDGAQGHFVDGLHDVLIGELSHLDSLAVISRTSVLRFRDTELTVGEIAGELGVDALLEGSVFRQGDTVRVNVQLIRARPEDHIWEGQYEGRLSQALALQARVAESVADEIRLVLSEPTTDYLAGRTQTEVDPAAQDAYLRAMALWRTRDFESLLRAIVFFEEAVEVDSTFALGWAGVANGYVVASGYDLLDIDRAQAMAVAERAARRGLSLEPELVESRVALGGILLFGRQNFRGAERELARALELAPSHAQAHDWLGDALTAQGRLEEGLRHYRAATQLDPFSPLMRRDYARALVMAGRCDEAVPEAETALDLDPRHFYALDVLRSCALEEERPGEAARLTFELAQAAGTLVDVEALRDAYGRGGMLAVLESEAQAFAEQDRHVLAAIRYARTGRIDEAFASLERALDTRQALLTLVREEPAFERLRQDSRWGTFLARLDALAEN